MVRTYDRKTRNRKSCKRLIAQLQASGKYKRVWAEYEPLRFDSNHAIRRGTVMIETPGNPKPKPIQGGANVGN